MMNVAYTYSYVDPEPEPEQPVEPEKPTEPEPETPEIPTQPDDAAYLVIPCVSESEAEEISEKIKERAEGIEIYVKLKR